MAIGRFSGAVWSRTGHLCLYPPGPAPTTDAGQGVATVIHGFARFARQHAGPARLLIVGGASEVPEPAATPEIGRLQQIAGNEGVAEYVSFLGRRNRSILKAIYSAADVFVTLPWYEPFGITPLEAMACGIPVIGSDVGGIKFSVCDGTTGYLIPPHDQVDNQSVALLNI